MRSTDSIGSFKNDTGCLLSFWNYGQSGTLVPYADESLAANLSNLGINATPGNYFKDTYKGKGYPANGVVTAIMPTEYITDPEESMTPEDILYDSIIISFTVELYLRGVNVTALSYSKIITYDTPITIGSVNIPYSDLFVTSEDDTSGANVCSDLYKYDYDEMIFIASVEGSESTIGEQIQGLAIGYLTVNPLANLG